MSDTPTRLGAALADRYRIERELGAGGMATVYLAHDLRHEREVAIKVLHPDLGAALGGERFLAEIKTTARLQHPHILPLLDSGSADGLLFYVMPYVRGETLRARLVRETQLPVADALRIAREVADALAEAHAQGIVHRDVKPENILLQGGHALVADFGIALAVQQAGGARMTQTGLSLGTPQYMAPEQAMGDKGVDHRADQYALAAVTYEMLTGEPPHSGANAQAIVAKLLTEAVRPATVLRPAVPAHVDAALQVALQKLPADRFPRVAEFSAALQGQATGHLPLPAAATGAGAARAPGSRRGLAVAGVALAALCAGGGWMLGRGAVDGGARASGFPRLEIPLESPAGFSDVASGFYTLAISDDGTMIAFNAADSTTESGLYLRRLTDGSVRRLTGEGVVAGAFSPDGRRLAYYSLRRGLVEVMELEGGNRTVTAARGGGRGLAWASDSVLVVSGAAVRRVTLGRSATDTLVRKRDDGLDYMISAPAGDGWVLAVLVAQRDREGEIVAISSRDGTVTSLGIRGDTPSLAPGGWLLYRTERTVFAQRVDTRTWTLSGARREVIPAGGTGRLFAVSPNGVMVAMRGQAGLERQLMLVDRTGRATPALPESRAYLSPRFSPDGRRLSFTVSFRASTGGDAWVADLASGTAARLTTDSAITNPEWSPDGQSLILSRLPRAKEPQALVRVPTAGGGAPTVLLTRPNPVYESQWSADGRTVVWREDAPRTGRDIFVMRDGDTTTTRALHATPFDERGLALGPDGTWFAFVSDESGRDEVYVARTDRPGAHWPVTRAGGIEPRWARNGELFFRLRDSVYVTRMTSSEPAPTFAPAQALFGGRYVSQGFEPRWDVSPDGQRFAMVRLPPGSAALQLSIHVGWLDALAREPDR